MSALLLWATSGVHVISQQTSQLPKRDDIVQALSQQFSTLVAGEAPILLFDQAMFLSDPSATVAIVPRENREFKEKFAAFMDGDVDNVIFGGLYVSDSVTIFTNNSSHGLKIEPGAYLIKLVRGPQLVARLIDVSGEVVLEVPAELQITTGASWASLPSAPWVTSNAKLMKEDPNKRVYELTFGFLPVLQTAALQPFITEDGPNAAFWIWNSPYRDWRSDCNLLSSLRRLIIRQSGGVQMGQAAIAGLRRL